MKNELVMEPMIDTIEEIDLVKNQDELTPEQRAYWLKSIERDMRNMDQPKKYVSLEQFGHLNTIKGFSLIESIILYRHWIQ